MVLEDANLDDRLDTSAIIDARSTGAATITRGRDHLADAVYRAAPGLTRQRARGFVDDVLAEIVDALAEDGKVLLSGFGVFTLVGKSMRLGRNPKTGEGHAITARTIVRFQASRRLKARVAGLEQEFEEAERPARNPRSRREAASTPPNHAGSR